MTHTPPQPARAATPESRDTWQAGRRLMAEALPPRLRLMALSVLCIFAVAGFTAALAWSTRLIVNDVFVAENASRALWVAGLVVFISAGKAVAQYGNSVVSVLFTRSVAAEYQKRLFRVVMAQDIGFFTGHHAANRMAQIKLFGDAAGLAVVALANQGLTQAVTLVALLVVMALQDIWMTLACSLLFPAIFWLVGSLSRRIRGAARAETDLTGLSFALGAEAIDGIKTVKTYGLEAKSVRRFEAAIDALQDRLLGIARLNAATVPLMEFLGGLAIGLFVVYAAWQTITVGKTPGEFTAFITAFLLAYQPAEKLSKLWVEVQKALVHVADLFTLLDTPPTRRTGGVQALPAGAPEIAFEAVTFRYQDGRAALEDVSFTIAPGMKVGIVGRSGAGKSTLIDLVMRFHDPAAGTVRLGGVDARDLSDEALRGAIALISQDVFLFDGSIAENIRDGNPAATDAEVAEAAARAALDDVIAASPAGLDAPVGPNGRLLSGGQKQRVAIARGLVRRAQIFIFDEATSALDAENEQRVMQALAAAPHPCTMLFVTHRPSTLDHVDQVLLLEAGQLVAFGPRAALESGSSRYRTLFNLALAEAPR